MPPELLAAVEDNPRLDRLIRHAQDLRTRLLGTQQQARDLRTQRDAVATWIAYAEANADRTHQPVRTPIENERKDLARLDASLSRLAEEAAAAGARWRAAASLAQRCSDFLRDEARAEAQAKPRKAA